jgi:hypothetical protein
MDDVLSEAPVHVVASNHLKPLELALADLQHASQVAGNIIRLWLSFAAGKVMARRPILEYNLAGVSIRPQSVVGPAELIHSEVATKTHTIGAVLPF